MTRTVFFGFGAYVGTISGQTTCSFWPDDPQSLGWSTAALVPVDLARNPTAVRTNNIQVTDIDVDDYRLDGGLTGIGPLWPGGQTISAVWLSETYYNSLGANKPPRQPASAPNDAHDYELTSILYWDGPMADRRFFGFHAKILSTQGPLSHVKIWHAGTSKVPGQPHAGIWWLDLAAVAHPVDPIATQIAPGGVTEGALFLDSPTASSLLLRMPKRPTSSGSGDFFP